MEAYGAVAIMSTSHLWGGREPLNFQGGSFYGGTCTHWIFGDEGLATELTLAELAGAGVADTPCGPEAAIHQETLFYTDKVLV
jgi:hypothetical protein